MNAWSDKVKVKVSWCGMREEILRAKMLFEVMVFIEWLCRFLVLEVVVNKLAYQVGGGSKLKARQFAGNEAVKLPYSNVHWVMRYHVITSWWQRVIGEVRFALLWFEYFVLQAPPEESSCSLDLIFTMADSKLACVKLLLAGMRYTKPVRTCNLRFSSTNTKCDFFIREV